MTGVEDVERAYRFCGQCGWDGHTTENSCPECGVEWFASPDGEVNGFAE